MGKTGFRILIFAHLVGVLLLSVALLVFGYHETPSFAFGGVIVAVNFYTLALVLKAIADKKSVAWAMLLVVFKYAIFGYFIYFLVGQKSLDLLAFALGVGSLALTAPIAGILITTLARGK